jgi:hypothetical protein
MQRTHPGGIILIDLNPPSAPAASSASPGRLLGRITLAAQDGHHEVAEGGPRRLGHAGPLPGCQPGITPQHPSNYQQALDWFTTEHPVLLGAVDQAATAGFDTHAWQLPWTP